MKMEETCKSLWGFVNISRQGLRMEWWLEHHMWYIYIFFLWISFLELWYFGYLLMLLIVGSFRLWAWNAFFVKVNFSLVTYTCKLFFCFYTHYVIITFWSMEHVEEKAAIYITFMNRAIYMLLYISRVIQSNSVLW